MTTMTYAAALAVLAAVATASPGAPTGLLCDFKKSPSLGVRAAPRFGWIVPSCNGGSDHMQVRVHAAFYHIDVLALHNEWVGGWVGGWVGSNDYERKGIV
jgi:hypothetical protein